MRLPLFPVCLLLTVCSSHPGAVVTPPQPPTVADATHRTAVMVVDGPGTPLVVDWMPEQRADLEAAMRTGVAVVAYDGQSLTLLNDCRIDGKYGFVGVTTKTQVVRLENADEIEANLPLAGAGLVAKLGGELARGTTLDVAMVIVGKTRTTWASPTRADLLGNCDRATHFVRGATVGAFVMDTGSHAAARTVAELFGAGVSGGSSAARGIRNQDGSLPACTGARPDASDPPSQCAALIRLELNPVAKSAREGTKGTSGQADQPRLEAAACPAGLVMSEGKCTAPTRAKAYTCQPGNAAECDAQCTAGSAESCDILGVMAARGEGVPRDNQRFARLTQRACELGFANGCLNHGVAAYHGWGMPQDRTASLADFGSGCQLGSAPACSNAGLQLFHGDATARNSARAAALYRMGCDGGDQMGCINLGVLYMGGDGVPVDPGRALALFQRACHGGNSVACGNLGLYFEFGMSGAPRDPTLAARLFERACELDPTDCTRLGILYQTGYGVTRDDAKARAIYAQVCRAGAGASTLTPLACSLLNTVYGDSRSVDAGALTQIIPVMKPQCDQRVARACGFLGAVYLGLGDATAGEAYLKAACGLTDAWACDILTRRRH